MRVLCASLLVTILFSGSAQAEEKVRIAIVEKATEIVIEGDGLEGKNAATGGDAFHSKNGKTRITLEDGSARMDGKKVDLRDGLLFKSRGFVQVGKKLVRGEIEIRFDAHKLTAINIISVEEYLAAVLGSEMPKSFPEEALKAQAVAARTYAVQRKIATWGKPYHLAATVLDQVYNGARAEDARTRKAVYATQGEVLVYKMEAIEAYFHASCGGETESGSEALNSGRPYLKSVSCICGEVNDSTWSTTLSAADLGRLAPGATEIEVKARTGSGRVKRLLLRGDEKSAEVTGLVFRQKIGYTRVKSLDFTISEKSGHYVLTGKGFGHGAGLCQWGAKAYALKGWSYRQILTHYYPGVKIQRMY